jgi:predicted RNase H-like nuclease
MAMSKLPYKVLGGIVPCPAGWLIVPARLAGVTVNVEDAETVKTLLEVLDYRPKFDAAAIFAPIGFFDEPTNPLRDCDSDAKDLIGWPRNVAVNPVPSRAALRTGSRQEALALEPWLTKSDLRRLKWWREAEREFQPFHQRMFFAAHPDLSYTSLNGDVPLTSSPYQQDGIRERMELLRMKMPGVEEIIIRTPPKGAAQAHVVQAAGLLWTARRAAARGMNRLPADAAWDSAGLRMELVR